MQFEGFVGNAALKAALSGALSPFSGNLPQQSVKRRRDFSLFAVARRGETVVF